MALLVGAAAVLALPACGAYRNAASGSGADGYGAAAADSTAQPSGSATSGSGGKSGSKGAASTTGAGAAAPLPKQPNATAAPSGVTRNALIRKAVPKMGAIVVNEKGWTLYRFDRDRARPATTNCSGTCAEVWPPVLTSGNPRLVGIDPALVGTIRRSDGSLQLTLHGWPMYRYIGDTKVGNWHGQGVGGTWWAFAPNGTKNLTCVPKVTPTAVPPPSSSGGSTY
jgi:predicted lipoprotein with Yx(FWY)xxD motif